jgi:hypothetical protein
MYKHSVFPNRINRCPYIDYQCDQGIIGHFEDQAELFDRYSKIKSMVLRYRKRLVVIPGFNPALRDNELPLFYYNIKNNGTEYQKMKIKTYRRLEWACNRAFLKYKKKSN